MVRKNIRTKEKESQVEFLRMSAADFRSYIKNEGNRNNQIKIEKRIDNKYHAKKKKVDGKTFDSTKESKRYLKLKELQACGIISGLECQKRFVLVEDFEYRGLKMRSVSWIADFYYFNGKEWVAEDVKSAVTRKKPEYIIKKKLFMLKYPDILFNEFL